LSRGVHEYSEEECLAMYPILKAVITLILDEQLIQRENKRIVSEAEKAIPQKLRPATELATKENEEEEKEERK
jgi:hypothetical protein